MLNQNHQTFSKFKVFCVQAECCKVGRLAAIFKEITDFFFLNNYYNIFFSEGRIFRCLHKNFEHLLNCFAYAYT